MKDLLARLRDLGYEKPRTALALLALSFFGLQYLFIAFVGPPGFGMVFGALSTVYLIAFLALSCEWFWARWFASGLGWSGSIAGVAGILLNGWHPVFGVYAGLHGLILLALLGQKMAVRYEMQPGWRERFGLDEFGVQRLRKAVVRGSAALPSLIIWALAPKDGAGMAIAVAVAASLTVLGLRGLIRLRTWSIFALAGATTAALLGAAFGVLFQERVHLFFTPLAPIDGLFSALVLSVFIWLPASLAPLAAPAWRYFLRLRG